MKGNPSEAKYKSELTIDKYTSINPETNGGYNRVFTAVWKKSPKESISIEMLLNIERERYEMFPLYFVWAVASGYSGTLIPFYRKSSREMVLKSKKGDSIRVYELEFRQCIGLLLLNCALFEGFETAVESEKRFENEIVYQAAYDYLQSSEQNRK